jgi:hypothetical protein
LYISLLQQDQTYLKKSSENYSFGTALKRSHYLFGNLESRNVYDLDSPLCHMAHSVQEMQYINLYFFEIKEETLF